ncbi:hypothetical protein I545_4671 [Mycobacterium kansasii 662]|uniref:Uncharacterized protein n=1 Tax=Mycobacterium kansasii 662 TaxID=1299326 RepID=X7Z427_MYCKA|nr:hypothetical protein I545_4671 [Mycobacterium kansasii 662]
MIARSGVNLHPHRRIAVRQRPPMRSQERKPRWHIRIR